MRIHVQRALKTLADILSSQPLSASHCIKYRRETGGSCDCIKSMRERANPKNRTLHFVSGSSQVYANACTASARSVCQSAHSSINYREALISSSLRITLPPKMVWKTCAKTLICHHSIAIFTTMYFFPDNNRGFA